MLKKINTKIPVWVNIFQILLILIMLDQAFMFFFNHERVAASGISVEGVPNLNLLYEMGARTAVMAFASIFVLITQNPKQFLVVLLMNIFREGQETIIDPLFPLANAPASSAMDFGIHVVIVAIEIVAFVVVFRISKRENKEHMPPKAAA